MDWPRAKTYLIVAFLLLNLFLAQPAWVGGVDDLLPLRALRTPSEARVKERLNDGGIVLLGRIPNDQVREMPMLAVGFAEPKAEALAEAFFGRAGASLETPEGSRAAVYRSVYGEILTVMPQGIVIYRRNLQAIRQARPLDPDQASREAEAFLARLGGALPAKVEFDVTMPVSADPPIYQVLYVQKHDGRRVFAGYVGVEVASGGVRSVKVLALEPLPQKSAARPVRLKTAEEALLALRKELINRRRLLPDQKLLVDRIDLGYYSRPVEWASQWEIPPVWRILTKDGQVYYVNVFTEELEGLQEESPPPT